MSENNLNPKSRGLGRGLNALFEDEEQDFAATPDIEAAEEQSNEDVSRETEEITITATTPIAGNSVNPSRLGIEQLRPGRFQPRQEFDKNTLEQLAESIRNHGVLQPLLVQRTDKDGSFEIIAGERRWRAAQLAQIHDVPVVVTTLDDNQALEVALIENLQREDLNAIEEAAGYQKLLDDFEKTQEELATSIGKSRSHIANMVRLLNLPDSVQAFVRDGKLSAGHARALVTAKNPEELAELIVKKKLSVRDTEKLVAEGSDRPSSKEASSKKSKGDVEIPQSPKDVNILLLEEELTLALGMRVELETRGDEGTLKIDFKSLDQLDELLARLSKQPTETTNRLMD